MAGNGQQQRQANDLARRAILASAKDMWLPIYSQTPVGAIPGQVLNIPLRNVGLIKRLLVEVTGNINLTDAGGGSTLTLSELGMANLFSNVQFTDLSNQNRVNTTGWHLHLLASARRQAAFGAAFYSSDSRLGVTAAVNLAQSGLLTSVHGQGPHFRVNQADNVIVGAAAPGTDAPFRWFMEVPIAYGDYDLRGAVYGNVVNATMNLQLTFNANPFVAGALGAVDTTANCYALNPAVGFVSNTLTVNNITVYQNFLDQLPMSQNGPILPLMDLAHSYMIQGSTLTGMAAATDFPIPFANFRQFLSTMVAFTDSATFLTGGAVEPGGNINHFALETANYTNIFRYDAYTLKLLEREIMGSEFPRGIYYFDTRRMPVVTTQQGNTQLIMNPNAAGATSRVDIGWEMLALIGQINQAGSLP